MYIRHITLSTGHTSSVEQDDVSGETLARVAPWLSALVESGAAMAIPASTLSGYTAQAVVVEGALVLTVSGPALTSGPMAGKAPPIVTIGVARRSRHGSALWPLMTGPVMPPAKAGLSRPAEPWAAAAIWPTAAGYPDAMEWLGDFERCVAWAWCNAERDQRKEA